MSNWLYSDADIHQDSPVLNHVGEEKHSYIRDQMRCFEIHEKNVFPEGVSNHDAFSELQRVRDTMVRFKI